MLVPPNGSEAAERVVRYAALIPARAVRLFARAPIELSAAHTVGAARSGLTRRLFGSVSTSIVDDAAVPVILVQAASGAMASSLSRLAD